MFKPESVEIVARRLHICSHIKDFTLDRMREQDVDLKIEVRPKLPQGMFGVRWSCKTLLSKIFIG